MSLVDATARHLRLLTETIAAVNSSLDLQEVLELVASKVADALGTDACFVYLYDERADELVLRATHGTRVEELTRTPRMRPGDGITGTAAAERAPVMIAAQAHLDPRFKQVPNLPEDEYESILAVPILARDALEGALNVRTRDPRTFTEAEIDLLVAIAAQVAQTIEHAKLYERAQRRVAELEALARISEAVSESLYHEESLEAIVKTTMESLHATGAALVLEDGKIAWPEGRAGAYAVRMPLRWKRRQIGELVCDRDTPFSPDDEALLEAIAHHAAVALEHGRAVMRGVLAQEIHHRVKNNLQSVASLLRLQARAENVDARKSLNDSVNRILAIAAVHEVLTEHREDDVDLGELVDRLRRSARARVARGSAGDGAGTGLHGALRKRARARRRSCLHRAGATQRRGRTDDRRQRRRDSERGDGHGPLDRPCARPRRTSGGAVARERRRPAGRSGVPSMTRVLVAEDETLIRLDLKGMLEAAGFDVCAEARDGEEAVSLARETTPDVALLDVKMPRLDGIEAARRILDERPIPIVMVTAYGERELVSRAVEAGVFGYLVKPFRETDLLPAIATATARHEELLALREEADSLAEALAARKAIERAKGILMQREGLTEDEAFARLRKASQISGRPLKVVAEALVATLGPDDPGYVASSRSSSRRR